MNHLMPRYLGYRVTSRLDVCDALPVRIIAMESYLIQELGYKSEKQKAECLHALCTSLVKIWGSEDIKMLLGDKHSAGWYDKLGGVTAQLSPRDKVCAAMAVQAHDLLRQLLPQLTLEDFSIVRQNPLFAAVTLEDDETLPIIIDHLMLSGIPNTRKALNDLRLRRAIEVAIESQKPEKAGLLLEYIRSSNFRDDKAEYDKALKHATMVVQIANIDVVRRILDKCPGGSAVVPDIFLYACKIKNIELVATLIQGSRMELNKGTVFTLPLHQAIMHGNIEVIGTILDFGADINNTSYLKSEECTSQDPKCPLEFALEYQIDAVDYLLERGAIVPSVDRWFETSNEHVYNALRTARAAQNRDEVIPTYAWSQLRAQKENRS